MVAGIFFLPYCKTSQIRIIFLDLVVVSQNADRCKVHVKLLTRSVLPFVSSEAVHKASRPRAESV